MLIVKEIQAKAILSKSAIHPYTLNPYTGCQHGCTYCYARFMRRFTGHKEPWGQFVDVKVNAAQLLRKEIRTKSPASVWMSGVCDPYQPVEARYRLTRQCLETFAEHDWPVVVQTRSPLVLRDLDVLRSGSYFEVGFSITTADDDIRTLFEPCAPPIAARIDSLAKLHAAGIRTFAMIAPMLPGAEGLADVLIGKIDRLLLDRMNYHHADAIYRKNGLMEFLGPEYYDETADNIMSVCRQAGIECRSVC
jgi:DNA repair photolyase